MSIEQSKPVVVNFEKIREIQAESTKLKQELIEKTISNFFHVDKGIFAVPLNDIANKIKSIKEIIKINGVLYSKYDEKLHELKNEVDLFSQINQLGRIVLFRTCDGGVTKKEVFSALSRESDQFNSINLTQTYPKEENVYYDCPEILPQKTGALDQLLSYFRPLDKYSKVLLKSLFITPAWGNGDGERPIFVIQSDPHWVGKKTAFGKSTVPDIVSHLYKCTPIRLSAKLDEFQAQKRIAMHRHSRVMLFDNVKQQNWSSEFVESMVTAKNFMGHLMYRGDICIRNHFTTIVTVNDPSVSGDMATRSVPVYLAHPGPKNGKWKATIKKFIDDNRDEIMADILQVLHIPTIDKDTSMRFPEWESHILNKIDPPSGMGDFIEQGQALIDSERANWWEEQFIEYLTKYTIPDYSNSHRNYFLEIANVKDCAWWIASEVAQKIYVLHSGLKNASGNTLGKKIKSEFSKFEHWDVTEKKKTFGRGTDTRGYFLFPKGRQVKAVYHIRQLPEQNRIVQPGPV